MQSRSQSSLHPNANHLQPQSHTASSPIRTTTTNRRPTTSNSASSSPATHFSNDVVILDKNEESFDIDQCSDADEEHGEYLVPPAPPTPILRQQLVQKSNKKNSSQQQHQQQQATSSTDESDLLEYYKSQYLVTKEQVKNLITSISDLTPQSLDLTTSRSQLQDKSIQLQNLHTYTSSLNSTLLFEKNKSLELQGVIEKLKVSEMELRFDNDELMEMMNRGGGEVDREVVSFYRDCRPEREIVRRSDSGNTNLNLNKSGSCTPTLRGKLVDTSMSSMASASSSRKPSFQSPTQTSLKPKPTKTSTSLSTLHTNHRSHPPHTRQLLRTVYLPNERTDSLILTVESLTSQLNLHKELSKETLEVQENEGVQARDNMKLRITEQDERVLELIERCEYVEGKWRHAVIDTNELIQSLQATITEKNEREVFQMGVLEGVRKERDDFEYELGETRKVILKHSEVNHRNLINQIKERESDILQLRENYHVLQTTYDQKITTLQGKLRESKDLYKGLEERRRLEISGFKRDMRAVEGNVGDIEMRVTGGKAANAGAGAKKYYNSTASKFYDSELNEDVFRLKNRVACLNMSFNGSTGDGSNANSFIQGSWRR